VQCPSAPADFQRLSFIVIEPAICAAWQQSLPQPDIGGAARTFVNLNNFGIELLDC